VECDDHADYALGAHTVEVLASTTTGETSAASVSIDVRDTAPLVLDVGFLGRSGNPITIIRARRRIIPALLRPMPVIQRPSLRVWLFRCMQSVMVTRLLSPVER
jgi:hypothetical protein